MRRPSGLSPPCLAGQDWPISLVVLTWALPGGGTLLLDGSHHAVAATRAGVAVALVQIALLDPVDPGQLPDLTHHR